MPGHRNAGLVYEMQPMLHSYFRPRAAHIHMSIFIMDVNIVFEDTLHYTLPTSVCVRESWLCVPSLEARN